MSEVDDEKALLDLARAGLHSERSVAEQRRGAKIASEQLQLAERLIRKGRTVNDAAEILGCHRTTLGRLLAERQFAVPTGGHPSPNRVIGLPEAEIVAEYQANPNVSAIARSYGISRAAVANLLQRNWLKLPRQIAGKGKPPALASRLRQDGEPSTSVKDLDGVRPATRTRMAKISDDQLGRAEESIRKGQTVVEAAAQLGCHRTTLGRLLGTRAFNTPRGKPQTEIHFPGISDETIIAEYRARPVIAPIAAKYGIGATQLARFLKQAGLKLPRQIEERKGQR